jgi:hypothetical protein
MSVQKKARDLRVGDKILGGTVNYLVESVKNSALTGSSYPVIVVLDTNGVRRTIETGANEKFQDHIYDVE